MKGATMLADYLIAQTRHLSFSVVSLASICFATTSAFCQNWTQTLAPSNAWVAVAASADLSTIAAVTSSNGIYNSVDGGTSWNLSNAPTNNWSSITCSTNGMKMAAVVNGGNIWISSDSGSSWMMSDAPSNVWAGIACSSDGTRMVATGNGVWFSTDSGDNWSLTSAPTNYWAGTANYGPVAASADGTRFVVGQTGPGSSIWTTADGGSTWAQTRGAYPYFSFASSTDGSILVGISDEVIVSTNFGIDWSLRIVSGQHYGGEFMVVAASADCSKLAFLDIPDGGITFLSGDIGITWTSIAPPDEILSNIAVSSDGNRLVAVANGGGIYTLEPTVPLIASGPQSQIVPGASTVEFSVGTFTIAAPQYQWLFDDTIVRDGTNSALFLTNITPVQDGNYSVIVSNAYGSTLSSNATLMVVPAFLRTLAADPWLNVASFAGTVTTGSIETLVWFEWGPTTNYGNSTVPISVSAAQGLVVSNLVGGLVPYTTYHCQIVASNAFGVVFGGDVTLTTVPRFEQAGTNTGWSALALSADGAYLAATFSNTVYISTNLGQTFTPTSGSGSVFGLSSNGTIILSVIESAFVVSTDGGVTWETNAAPNSFAAFAASSSGNIIVGADDSDTIYMSTNLGKTWYSSSDPGAPASLACSVDGACIYGTRANATRSIFDGFGYLSTNLGNTWNTFATPEVENSTIACSGDGSLVAVTGELGAIISTNYGNSWQDGGPPFSYSATVSGDGSTLASLGGTPSTIYSSPDGGASWYQDNGPFFPGGASLMLSGNGSVLAALSGGVIYIATAASKNPFELTATLSATGGVPTLNLTGQAGYTAIVEASSDLVHWTDIATPPNPTGTVSFTDPDSTNYPARFYRVLAP